MSKQVKKKINNVENNNEEVSYKISNPGNEKDTKAKLSNLLELKDFINSNYHT